MWSKIERAQSMIDLYVFNNYNTNNGEEQQQRQGIFQDASKQGCPKEIDGADQTTETGPF